jgi:hypothetical protein
MVDLCQNFSGDVPGNLGDRTRAQANGLTTTRGGEAPGISVFGSGSSNLKTPAS